MSKGTPNLARNSIQSAWPSRLRLKQPSLSPERESAPPHTTMASGWKTSITCNRKWILKYEYSVRGSLHHHTPQWLLAGTPPSPATEHKYYNISRVLEGICTTTHHNGFWLEILHHLHQDKNMSMSILLEVCVHVYVSYAHVYGMYMHILVLWVSYAYTTNASGWNVSISRMWMSRKVWEVQVCVQIPIEHENYRYIYSKFEYEKYEKYQYVYVCMYIYIYIYKRYESVNIMRIWYYIYMYVYK